MAISLSDGIHEHWRQLRAMTYDLLDHLTREDLEKRLPFPESQTLGYQFWCMLGAQESWLPLLRYGTWQGFTCSLDQIDMTTDALATIKAQFRKADAQLFEVLDSGDLLRELKDGATPLTHYLNLVEHEAHHQGQLINFIYAIGLAIPESWAEKWALSRDG